MQGFFSKKETESVSAVGGKIHSCASCGLYKGCQSPKMKPYGQFEKQIMVIGEAPDLVDDQRNKPFQGRAGKLLQHTLRKHGIDLFKDCISLNAINCYTEEAPSGTEIDHCRSVVVWKALQEYQPKVILVLGEGALNSLIGHRWQGGISLNTFRGFCIPDQDIKSWVCPTFSPQWLQKIDSPAHYMRIWERDLKGALKKIKTPLPRVGNIDIRFVEDSKFLDDIPPVLSSWDYETTGIKPHMKGHKIVCTSIADREDRVWVFPRPETKAGWQPFRRWLYNKRVSKMAHNAKFEIHWSKEILKVDVRGLEWDSMLAAHVLDNRPGVTGLKFQTYVNFGVVDYSSEVGQYLRSVGNKYGANTKNQVEQLVHHKQGREKLMKYCALDSVYQYRLALKQMEELNYDFLPF